MPCRLTWKALFAGVHVVELQRRHTAVVATQRAAPARFSDQDLLDLATATDDRFDTASQAAHVAAPVDAVLSLAVRGAGCDQGATLGDVDDLRARGPRFVVNGSPCARIQ